MPKPLRQCFGGKTASRFVQHAQPNSGFLQEQLLVRFSSQRVENVAGFGSVFKPVQRDSSRGFRRRRHALPKHLLQQIFRGNPEGVRSKHSGERHRRSLVQQFHRTSSPLRCVFASELGLVLR